MDEKRVAQRSQYTLKSLDNAITLLETIATASEDIGLSDVSRSAGVSKSAAFRILDTLVGRGLVAQDASSKRYRLGPHLVYLGKVTIDQNTPVKIAHKYLVGLTEQFNEASHFVTFDGNNIVFMDKVESSRPASMGSRIGFSLPAYCTGTGKALLANMNADKLERYLEGYNPKSLTNNTLISRQELEADLGAIRQRGYSIDNEESEDGLMCIAAPVKSATGIVESAISISGPKQRIEPQKVSIAEAVIKASKQISTDLGWRED